MGVGSHRSNIKEVPGQSAQPSVPRCASVHKCAQVMSAHMCAPMYVHTCAHMCTCVHKYACRSVYKCAAMLTQVKGVRTYVRSHFFSSCKVCSVRSPRQSALTLIGDEYGGNCYWKLLLVRDFRNTYYSPRCQRVHNSLDLYGALMRRLSRLAM